MYGVLGGGKMKKNIFYPVIGVSPITGFSSLEEHLYLKTCDAAVVQKYFNWFLEFNLIRVETLKGEIKNWEANYTLHSLIVLEEWLMLNINSSPSLLKKMQTLLSSISTGNFETDVTELSEVEISILYDVGIYFGNMLCHNNKDLHWGIFMNHTHIQYNLPMISKNINGYQINYHHLTNMLSWYNTKKEFTDYTLVSYYNELTEIFKHGYVDEME